MLQYPWTPHKTLYLDQPRRFFVHHLYGRYPTLEEATEQRRVAVQFMIDYYLNHQINDVIYLSVQNSLRGTVDSKTTALAQSRIPSDTNNNTLRFLIAFLYEKQLGFEDLVNSFPIGDHSTYFRFSIPESGLHFVLADWNERASKIVEVMEVADTKVGKALSENPDFIRNAALIELGQKTGLEFETKANAISFNIGETSDQGNTISRTLAANSTFYMEKASDFRIAGTRANNTDTLKITSRGGPNEITVTTNGVPVKSVLAKDASKTLVSAELMGSVVSTQPILKPVATRTLPDITDLEVAEVQSVNIDGLFTSIRGTITASSASQSIATVSVNDRQTSMGVTGVAIGTTKITVTDTNEAGATSVTFDLTIIAASD